MRCRGGWKELWKKTEKQNDMEWTKDEKKKCDRLRYERSHSPLNYNGFLTCYTNNFHALCSF
jgi:hypothetical protein